jgi:hypothetical protein
VCSLPYSLMSSSVKTPSGKRSPGSRVPSSCETQRTSISFHYGIKRRRRRGEKTVRGRGRPYLVEIAQRCTPRICPSLFTRRCRRQIPTSRVDRLSLLLPRHFWVETEVLPRGETDASEALVRAAHLLAVLHETLELGEGLFDLGHCSGAVDEFPVGGVELGWKKGRGEGA